MIVSMLLLLNFQQANSQCTEPWCETGNAITNPLAQWIGTTTNRHLDFRTVGDFRMRIDSTGKVGIANVPFIPNSPLHLYNSGTSASIFAQISNGNTTYSNGLRFGINSTNEGVINMYDAKPLNFFTNNTPKMTIIGSSDSTDGNVGIGTTIPTEKLQVNGNILASGKILVADEANIYDLLALILQLQNEVAALKQQLTAAGRN